MLSVSYQINFLRLARLTLSGFIKSPGGKYAQNYPRILAVAVPVTGTTLALLGIAFSGLAFLRARLK
jgi:hypothetical protein